MSDQEDKLLSKTDKEAGYRAAPRPTPHMAAVLRRAAAGYIMATHEPEGTVYAYEDGAAVLDAKRKPVSSKWVSGAVSEGWLIPIEGETLLEGSSPQRWRARRPADGNLPRTFKKW